MNSPVGGLKISPILAHIKVGRGIMPSFQFRPSSNLGGWNFPYAMGSFPRGATGHAGTAGGGRPPPSGWQPDRIPFGIAELTIQVGLV